VALEKKIIKIAGKAILLKRRYAAIRKRGRETRLHIQLETTTSVASRGTSISPPYLIVARRRAP